MARNLNKLHQEKQTKGEKAADKMADFVGSWSFLIIISVVLVFWIILNVIAYELSWDPYPFILLNLLLSVVAAVQGPIILMSQNRMEKKDRLRSELDYETDIKAEKEIEEIKKQLEEIKSMLKR